MYFGGSQMHLPTVKQLFSSRCRDSNLGSCYPWYSKFAEHVHSHYHFYLSCSACCRVHFLMEAFSLHISTSHLYIHMNTHLFESSSEVFYHNVNTHQCIKVLFQHPFVKIFGLFCFASLTLYQCNVIATNIYQLHISIAFITLNSTCGK